jgi:endonuclease/exonuclease/phosphatase family metal-dependent hydrolase
MTEIISLLQWNTWYDEKTEHIVEFIRDHRADILCLQELTGDEPRILADALGYQLHSQELPIVSTTGEKRLLHNAILSRFPMTNRRIEWINDPAARGGYGGEARAYVAVELDVNSNAVTIGTTHLSYTHEFEDAGFKRDETDRLLKAIAGQGDRFVLAGDLNAMPGSYTVSELAKRFVSAGPDDDQKTWTTKPFSYNGFEANTLDWRLDYVFMTPDIRSVKSAVLPTKYSDHLPVRVELALT